ncbi:MAG: hypothetical protein VCD00_02250 [Candidatus Hydrogenedentota bacterium]
MKTRRFILMGICGAMLVGASAVAQERGARGPHGDGEGRERPPLSEIIQKHDANGDGILQSSEMPERFPKHLLEILDSDNDGALSIAEAEKGLEMRARGERPQRGERPESGARPEGQSDRPERGQRPEHWDRPERGQGQGFDAVIERFDLNGDGKLQLDETPDRMTRMFARLDRNGDDTIDKREASAMREQARRGPERGPRDDRRGPEAGDGPPRRGSQPERGEGSRRPGDRTGVEIMISQMDANGDGRLDKSEMAKRMEPFFDRLDTNGDGVLTPEDSPKHRREADGPKRPQGRPGVEQRPE